MLSYFPYFFTTTVPYRTSSYPQTVLTACIAQPSELIPSINAAIFGVTLNRVDAMSNNAKIIISALLGLGGIIALFFALFSNNALIVILLWLIAVAAEIGALILATSSKRK